MRRTPLLPALAGVLLLLVSGCGDGPAPAATNAASSAERPTTAQPPVEQVPDYAAASASASLSASRSAAAALSSAAAASAGSMPSAPPVSPPVVPTVAPTAVPTAVPAPPAPPSGCPAGVVPPAGVSQVVCGGAPAGARRLTTFRRSADGRQVAVMRTPSGNLGCQAVTGQPEVICGAASLRGDGGGSWLYVFDGSTAPSIAGRREPLEWQSGAVQVLGYGQAATWGDIACLAERSGLTCWSTTTHHGFQLSRERAQAW